MNAFKLGKAVVFLNGITCSSYIACFIPSVIKTITPSNQLNNMNEIGKVNRNYMLLSFLCLGVSNLMSLPNFDISSTCNQLIANAFGYTIFIASNIYQYKYYPNAYNKKFTYFNIGINSLLLLTSFIAINKIIDAFPNATLRAIATVPHKKKKIKR